MISISPVPYVIPMEFFGENVNYIYFLKGYDLQITKTNVYIFYMANVQIPRILKSSDLG